MPVIKVLRTGCLAIAAVCGVAACATITVRSEVNAPLVHSVQCHTFAWAGSFQGGALAASIANPVNEADLRAAIAAHMQFVGARPVTGGADCLVGYGIGVHNVLEGAYPYGWGWGWGRGWGWGGPWWGEEPFIYPEAVIGVDLYDGRGGQPLWHADAGVDLASIRGAKAAQGIDAAVAAIFTKYLE